MTHILVTGGYGFIGSNFIEYLFDQFPQNTDMTVTNVDKLDYCSSVDNVSVPPIWETRYASYRCDINNTEFIMHILKTHSIDTVVHFAAQSHVDNSFGNSLSFTKDNVMGTHSLLECCRVYGNIQRFVHISTDEVYGEVDAHHEGCSETSLLNPTNPYAATKAAAEFIVRSYFYSYQLPVVIVRGNNVFGPHQYPEKLISRSITRLLRNEKCIIQGIGETRRNFIYVRDFVRGVWTITTRGELFHIYNIGTQNEWSVKEIIRMLIREILGAESSWQEWVEYTEDRLFNDQRYCINTDSLKQLGWKEEWSFAEAMRETIVWYREQHRQGKACTERRLS